MDIPLQNRLKKRAHVEVALAQDELADILYSLFPKIVFHGGTCVWRCYGGSRFSEDLDFYIPAREFDGKRLGEALQARGMQLDKLKKTQNLVFAKISSNKTQVRLEINFAVQKKAIARPYEKADGSFMDVLCLPAQELLAEKFSAYLGRKFVRDMYDVYFLSRIAEADGETASKIGAFLRSPFAPIDEKNLRAIVYAGAIPTYAQMLEALRGRFA